MYSTGTLNGNYLKENSGDNGKEISNPKESVKESIPIN